MRKVYQVLVLSFIQSRIAWNMSQFDFCINSIQQLPSCPDLAQTLLLIQTHKFLPLSSTVSLGQKMPDNLQEPSDCDLSLELKLDNANYQTLNSASLLRKKKGGCTCKKTKCLKMYCECFASGKMCGPECGCLGCSNCQRHAKAVAKAKETLKVKISTNRSNGSKACTCKKSQCRKKYCECFSAGVACGGDCKCEDCLNGDCDKHQEQGKQIEEREVKSEVELFSSFVSF